MIKNLLCATAMTLALAMPAFAAETGKPAPAFETKDIAGNTQSLAQYKGKIVVLEWNNPECPFVKKHYDGGDMQALQEYATSKDVVWLAINSGAEGKQGNMTADAAKAKIAEVKSAASAYILDPQGTIGQLYSAKTTPHMYIVDKDGNLAYQGAIDSDSSPSSSSIKGATNYVRAAVDELLAGKKPTLAETKSYGCGVKY
ncbi:MAG: thioredoxin family protein [Alphaproteobacteria bacterium]|nr:thioredoxin family protein [Alphaproteobacteria bacterium]